MKLRLLTILICYVAQLNGQDTLMLPPIDSTQVYGGEKADTLSSMMEDSVLTYSEYLYWVENYHPISLVSGYEVDLAERNVRVSRGGFDPMLYGNFKEKVFKDTDYYERLNAGIEIPTWMGLSVVGGFEENSGVFLNPEGTVPDRGLFNAGIKANLGAGLIMDDRRAALRQAQIGLDMGINQRQILLNDLYLEATRAYFNWAFANQLLQVAEEALDVASVRYQAVIESYKFGDRPAIDTVEAYTQVLNRIYRLREAQNEWIESVNLAATYLWGEDLSVINIPPGIVPELETKSLSLITGDIPLNIPSSHPELMMVRNKRSFLDIDRRLFSQKLLPKVEVNYNVLAENISPAGFDEYFDGAQFFENNYTFGAKVSFPLFIREARGKLGATKIKLDMNQAEFDNKRALLEAKLNAGLVKLSNIRDQVNIYEQNVEYLDILLEGERALFNIGESSLFLVNSRETKLIEGYQIYYSLIAKEKISTAIVRNTAGLGF